MNPNNVTTKIWIAVGVILACILIGYFGTWGYYTKFSESSATQRQLKQTNDSLNQQIATTENFLKTYESNKNDAQKLKLTLPVHDTDMSNFIASLGELATASGVSLGSIQIGDTSNRGTTIANTIQPVDIRLVGSGSYPSFKDFMIRLEKHLRITDIGNVTMNAQDGGVLQFGISVTTYYQK